MKKTSEVASGVVEPAIQRLETWIEIASKHFKKVFNYEEEQGEKELYELHVAYHKTAWKQWLQGY